MRIYWGVHGVIHLKENDDQRTVIVRKRNSVRTSSPEFDTDDEIQNISRDTSCNDISTCSSNTSFDISRSDTGIESGTDSSITPENSPTTPPLEPLPKSVTLPSKLDVKNLEWDEFDELLQVERKYNDSDKMYQTMPVPLPSQSSIDSNCSSHSIKCKM